jgi:hypothetical protein
MRFKVQNQKDIHCLGQQTDVSINTPNLKTKRDHSHLPV